MVSAQIHAQKVRLEILMVPAPLAYQVVVDVEDQIIVKHAIHQTSSMMKNVSRSAQMEHIWLKDQLVILVNLVMINVQLAIQLAAQAVKMAKLFLMEYALINVKMVVIQMELLVYHALHHVLNVQVQLNVLNVFLQLI